MPYDAKLDECLFAKSIENDLGKLTVGVYAYNKGIKKLQIGRENSNPEGELRFAKLGRMTKDEVAAILPLIQEALTQMD